MSDHYITAMANNGGLFVVACRCGTVFSGIAHQVITDFQKHQILGG